MWWVLGRGEERDEEEEEKQIERKKQEKESWFLVVETKDKFAVAGFSPSAVGLQK